MRKLEHPDIDLCERYGTPHTIAFSPRGTHLASNAFFSAGLFDLSDSTFRPLTISGQNMGLSEFDRSNWSPDGRQFAFVRYAPA